MAWSLQGEGLGSVEQGRQGSSCVTLHEIGRGRRKPYRGLTKCTHHNRDLERARGVPFTLISMPASPGCI